MIRRPPALAGALLLALAGCGPSYSPNTYDAAAAQQANKVERGIVVGWREVKISADGTVGTVTGGAAGGIAGSQTPFGPVTRAFTALGGTLVGGIAGSAAEHAVGDTAAWEYIIKEPNNDLLSVTQRDKSPLPIGTTVLVITGKQARVVPDYTVPLAVPASLESPPAKPAVPPTPAPPPAATAAGPPAPLAPASPPALAAQEPAIPAAPAASSAPSPAPAPPAAADSPGTKATAAGGT